MPAVEETKRLAEQLTGFARPDRQALAALVRTRKANRYHFRDDGETPNNRRPLVIYRSPVRLPRDYDPATIFEGLFASHGWANSWRNGVYKFLHFHTRRHEVLGFARGSVEIAFGGAKGKQLLLKAGDVAILPAGTGHQRVAASRDLLVVGAYPENSGTYDEPKPSEADHQKAVRAIAAVPPPKQDPVYGFRGPLIALWRSARSRPNL